MGEFVAETPKHSILRKNLSCNGKLRETIMEQATEGLKSVFPDQEELLTIDGIRLTLKGGWLLVRMSGTEPVIRITVEGESLKEARQIMEKGARYIKKLLGNDD